MSLQIRIIHPTSPPIVFLILTQQYHKRHIIRFSKRNNRSLEPALEIIDPDFFFEGIVLFAPFVELKRDFLMSANVYSGTNLDFNYPCLLARIVNRSSSEILIEMDKYGLSTEQQNFIMQWSRREFSLVRQHTGKKSITPNLNEN